MSASQLPVDAHPFRVDPLWGWLASRRLHWLPVLVFWLVLDLACVLTCSAVGDLWTSRGASAINQDFVAFFTAGHVHSSVPSVPLLQDYAGMILLLTIPISAALIWRQFRLIELLHTRLIRFGCLDITDLDKWKTRVAKLNDSITLHGRFWWIRFSGCFALAYVLIDSFDRPGFYRILSGSASSAHTNGLVRYANWWASVNPVAPGFFWLEVIGGYGIYLVATQITFGWLYVQFLFGCRPIASFSADLSNVDGYYGWRSVRIAIGTVIGSILAGTGSSFALYLYLEPTVGLGAASIAALIIVAPNLLVLLVAVQIYREDMQKFKENRIAGLLALRPTLSSVLTADELALYGLVSSEIVNVSQVPDLPFRRRTVLAVVTLSLVPFLATVVSVVQTARG